jgi:hypothetical protein
MRQKVEVELVDVDLWAAGDVQALTRAISYGHPTITGFDSGSSLRHQRSDTLFDTLSSALATQPALEWVNLGR